MINKKELNYMTSWEKFKQEWRDFVSDVSGKLMIGMLMLALIVLLICVLRPY